jgi:ATP synthase subunit 6
MTMIHSPLEQFEVTPVWSLGFGEQFAFTNTALFGFIVMFAILGILSFGTKNATIVPNRWQTLVEGVFEFVLTMARDTITGSKGEKYFPYLFVTFLTVAMSNLIGMIPYSFTITSQLAITFAFGMVTFLGVNIIAVRQHGLHFLSFFLPKDAPMALWLLLVPIEIISYVFRVISLSVRLFVNMMAGHALLKILAGFAWTMIGIGGIMYVAAGFPLLVLIVLTGMELGIALLQAYVWTVLVCIYLNDAINLH